MLGVFHRLCRNEGVSPEAREHALAAWSAHRQTLDVTEPPGGIGPECNDADHWALSFAQAGQMTLHDARGEADDSLRDRWPGTWYYLGGGPSLAAVDLTALQGHQVLAVNSVAELFPRPTVWLGVDPPDDPPDRFRGVPWDVEGVLKLLPRGLAGCDAAGEAAYERPNTRFFLRNHRFLPETFLAERTVNWGSDVPFGSGRSVMLAALKLLWYLGAARVVLLGVDWWMDPARPYAHSATKDERACAMNNKKFAILEERFRALNPYLERAGMIVVNATDGSRLRAFPATSLAYELANEDLFAERRGTAPALAEMTARGAQARAEMSESTRLSLLAKACPCRDCKSCTGEANCSAGKGDRSGGRRATLAHCCKQVEIYGSGVECSMS